MVKTVLEMMFYNNNDRIGVLITLVFFMSNTGKMKVREEKLTYLP